MKLLEVYKKYGLENPISIRPGLKFHLLLWGGGSLLIIGSMFAMLEGSLIEKLVGLFGALFFGIAFVILIYAFLNSRDRGTLEISDRGIYMSHIGTVLPWSDIGPVWIATAKHENGKTKDVVFVLRNVSQHTKKMGTMGKMLMKITKNISNSKPGGALDWGLKAFFIATEADSEIKKQLSKELARMREIALTNTDASVFNIPIPLRLGISAEDLVGIMNHEVAINNKLIPMQ